MPTLPKPKQKAKQKQLPLTSRLDKIIANRVEQGMAYEYDNQDKRELVFNDLRKRYPDTLKLSYQWVMRVKQENNVGGLEYLVYHCNEQVTDRDNNDHYFDSLVGVWPAVEAKGKINPETGERENASVKRTYNVFDIPFTEENAKQVLYDKRLILQPSQFVIGIANDDWGEVITGAKWTVFNVEEFIEADFDVLYWGAEHGFLQKKKGGAKRARDALEGIEEEKEEEEKKTTPQIPPKRK